MKIKVFATAALLLCGTLAFGADLSANADYKAKCAMCHGANGEGKPAMKTVPMKEVAGKSDAELTEAITKGKGKMPAYEGKLSADQVKALVSAIKAQK